MESTAASSTWGPDGTFSFEVNGFFASKIEDVVTFRSSGIGWRVVLVGSLVFVAGFNAGPPQRSLHLPTRL